MMSNNISLLDIRGIIKSKSFSTLSSNTRKEIFFAKSSLGVSALQLVMEQNHFNSMISYDDFLEELSYDEQLSLLPEIIHTKSPKGVPALFMTMQKGHVECVNNFALLINRLINIGHRIPTEDFSEILFNALLSKRKDGCSALSMAVSKNNTGAILAFGNLLDSIFILKDSIGSEKLSSIIFRLLDYKDNQGATGLFIALQGRHTDTVIAFGELISKLALLRHGVPESVFNSMILCILRATAEYDSMPVPAILMLLARNYTDVIDVYSSLLIYASKEVRREIFCIKDSNGLPVIYLFVSYNDHKSLISYDYFLQALSCDEKVDLLPSILISQNNNGDPALLIAMKEGYSDCIDAYGNLMKNQLLTIKYRMSPDDFAGLVLNIALAKGSDGTSALFMGMSNNRVGAIEAYSVLLDKVLLLLKDTISDDKLADIIYMLISYGSPLCDKSPIFVAMNNGYADSVASFGLLIDKLILMKDYISHDKISNMVFKWSLNC
ncbi:hypothetical protein [Candidatus Ichthyocystis sparus]|nr:hypothetical protein [Candidatus Ichthyocystis sparus]